MQLVMAAGFRYYFSLSSPLLFSPPLPSPGQMSSRDTVHDLSQLLLERPESCYRTCTSAWHNKKRLDDFSELGMVEELQPGDQVELVEGGLRGGGERGRGRGLREIYTLAFGGIIIIARVHA